MVVSGPDKFLGTDLEKMAWHLVNALRVVGQVTLTKLDLIRFPRSLHSPVRFP